MTNINSFDSLRKSAGCGLIALCCTCALLLSSTAFAADASDQWQRQRSNAQPAAQPVQSNASDNVAAPQNWGQPSYTQTQNRSNGNRHGERNGPNGHSNTAQTASQRVQGNAGARAAAPENWSQLRGIQQAQEKQRQREGMRMRVGIGTGTQTHTGPNGQGFGSQNQVGHTGPNGQGIGGQNQLGHTGPNGQGIGGQNQLGSTGPNGQQIGRTLTGTTGLNGQQIGRTPTGSTGPNGKKIGSGHSGGGGHNPANDSQYGLHQNNGGMAGVADDSSAKSKSGKDTNVHNGPTGWTHPVNTVVQEIDKVTAPDTNSGSTSAPDAGSKHTTQWYETHPIKQYGGTNSGGGDDVDLYKGGPKVGSLVGANGQRKNPVHPGSDTGVGPGTGEAPSGSSGSLKNASGKYVIPGNKGDVDGPQHRPVKAGPMRSGIVDKGNSDPQRSGGH